MSDYQEMNKMLRANEDARRNHDLICDILRGKDFVFSDLIDLAQSWGVFFVFHESLPGNRWWSVVNPLSIDKIGKMKMAGAWKIISVPTEVLEEEQGDRRDLFRKEFELAHEFGHIVFIEKDDGLNKWLDCPFMRLSTSRECPYSELRASEEGMKILEGILEKYDIETKTKRKLNKFFRRIYLSPEYRKNFSSDCNISLEEGKIALKEGSDFCPVLGQLKEVLTRLNY